MCMPPAWASGGASSTTTTSTCGPTEAWRVGAAPASAGTATTAATKKMTRFKPTMVRRGPGLHCPGLADVAELVDAHGSGPCGGNPVEVQVLSSASPDQALSVVELPSNESQRPSVRHQLRCQRGAGRGGDLGLPRGPSLRGTCCLLRRARNS